MSLINTPRASRIHISLFGNRNSGKSSIINAITNQDIALISPTKGTTTDPVYKSMELLPIGPVVFIDTAGLDDIGKLGELRRKKTMDVLNKTDVALLIIDGTIGITHNDKRIIKRIKKSNIPLLGVINKSDLISNFLNKAIELEDKLGIPFISTSAYTRKNINELKNFIIKNIPSEDDKFKIVGDLINSGDIIVMVIPIDKAAPKGRLILPQQQTIRDILESDAIAVIAKEHELKATIKSLNKKPKLIITDSQAFLKVSADTPKDICLTSFSILFARYKGELFELVKGTKAIEHLKDNDKVLIAEACTHHRQADDIAHIKIPRWIKQLTGKKINFEYCSGSQFPSDLSKYSLIIHCGGCMLNKRAMMYRISEANKKGIPIVNYGVLIAYVHGILERALEPFPLAKLAYEEEFNDKG